MNRLMSIAAGALVASSLAASAATVVSTYTFDSGLTDSLSGGTASGAGDVTGGRYNFDANEGLNVTMGSSLASYSIVFGMELDAVTSYRKLLDFAGLSSDNGLYVFSGGLRYYNSTLSGGSISANVDSTIALTFDGTTTVGYVDGTQAFSFAQAGTGYPSALTSFTMFEDDTATSKREASAGSLDFLEVYDGVLSASEVASYTAPEADPEPVPLPAGGLLLLTGLAGLLVSRRKSA